MGLTIGRHGSRLEDTTEETRQFINQLTKAADQSSYLLHRLHLAQNPLRLVIIGRSGRADEGSRGLTDRLITRDDLFLTDDKYRKSDLEHFKPKAKDSKVDGPISNLTTSLEDQEIYGPIGGDGSKICQYISKVLLHYLGQPDFKRVYQHCSDSNAVLGCGKIVELPDKSCRVKYSKSIISEVEAAGISYAVLLPKREERFMPTQEKREFYEQYLIEEAKKKLSSIKDTLF